MYKNRTAEAWKNRGTGGVPGAELLKDGSAGPGEEKLGGAAGKNAKRRESESILNEADEKPSKEPPTVQSKAAEIHNWREKEKEPPADLEAEKEKQARNLKKKLRQARNLREKKDKGENLLPEQFEKVIKIQELIRQLEGLGVNSEGNRKENLKVGNAQ